MLSIDGPDGSNLGTNIIGFQGYVIQVTDTFGQTTDFTYDNDGFGYKTSETDALGDVKTWTYDANGNVLIETVQRTVNGILTDETTSFEYDSLDQLIKTTDALGNITQQVYDEVGNKVQDIDALGRITAYTHDPYRRLTRTGYADGSFTTSSYDTEGNLVSETDANGNTTSFTYDALNRLIQTTYVDGSSVQTGYDAVGRVSSQTDEHGNVTAYQYDAAGRRTQTTNALLQSITSSYDVNGNLETVTDAKGSITTYEYDIYDNRINTLWPDASTSSEAYDARSRLTGKTDQNGNTMSFGYDALDRLITVTDALNNVTSYGYDEVGNKLTQTDANLHTTSWAYDAIGRELTRTLPLGQVESNSYDPIGNRSQMTDFNSQVTAYGYDSQDRLSSVTYHDSSTESFGYDNSGNRTSANNRNGSSQSWTYDSRNRLTQVNDGKLNQIDYQYDLASNKTQQTTTPTDTGIGQVTGYSYDVLNRLQTVTDSNNNITTYSYDENGNRATVAYPNGNTTSYVYQQNNRLIQQTTLDSLNNTLADYQYTLDPSGHRLSITEPNRTTTYTYDVSYKLLTEDIVDPINGNHNASYDYDAVGNRTYSTINGVQTLYSYDANDRLTQQGGEVFGYDDNGNTVSKTLDSEVSSFAYNAKNLLSSASLLEAGVTTNTGYQYDIDGIRVQKADDTETTDYLIDPNRDYAQVVRETRASTASSIDYLYGDDLIAQSQGNTDERYYLYDGLGSTRLLTDGAGAVTDSYDYEAFGTTLNQTGESENDYLFTGEQFDGALDNYYLRARYYDPGSARFTQMDSWRGNSADPVTLHKYLYANTDPVNMVDPSGRFSIGGLLGTIRILASNSAGRNFLLQSATSAATSRGAGLLVLAGLTGASGAKLSGLLDTKVEENNDGPDETYYHGTTGNAASKIRKRGFRDIPTYFAEDIPTARHFANVKAAENSAGSTRILTLTIPKAIRVASGMRRRPIGEDLGLPFVDIPGSTGLEWAIGNSLGLQVVNGAIFTGRATLQ